MASLSEEEKKVLLSLARKSIEEELFGKRLNIEEKEISQKLKQKRGCFVTLNKNHDLRGCIGTILPYQPLFKCVIDNAKNAAFQDPRFRPLSKEEFSKIKIEISVLTEPKEITFSTPEELIEKLQPGKHGVIIEKYGFSATFLPQVWEHFRTKEEFLGNLCLKAGLSPNCWKENCKVLVYEAEVFE